MPRLYCLSKMTFAGVLALTSFGRCDDAPAPRIEHVRAALKVSNDLKAKGAWKEFLARRSEAEGLYQEALAGLEKKRDDLAAQKQELETLFKESAAPEILVTSILAEAIDLDAATLETARKLAHAELIESGPASGDEPQLKTYCLKSDDLKAFLGSIEKRRHLHVLSRPTILTTDGQVATVSIGQTVPRPTAVTIKKSGEIETTSEETNVGFTLSVVPSIESEVRTNLGLFVLESTLSGESITLAANSKSGETITSPVVQTRRFNASLTSDEGQTLIVALETKNAADTTEAPKTTLVVITAHQVSEKAESDAAKPAPFPAVKQAGLLVPASR